MSWLPAANEPSTIAVTLRTLAPTCDMIVFGAETTEVRKILFSDALLRG